MRTSSKWLGTLLLSSVLVAPAVIAGCSDRVVTYHDPYYNDDHVWDAHETVYYTQWEHETHRDHKDFKVRTTDEQKEYYTWRHGHPDQR
jgi:hypothetical protein